MVINFKQQNNGWWATYLSPQDISIYDVYSWCVQTFGELGDRWEQHGGWFKFRTEADVAWFTLKWS